MRYSLINSDSINSLIKEIDETISNKFMPTLAFIFLSVKYDVPYLVKILKKYKFIVVGSTTAGEIYADNRMGVHSKEKSIVCMLTDMDASAFSIKLKKSKNNKFFNLGEKVGEWVNRQFLNATLLTLTAGLDFDNESYINGVQSKNHDIFGGVAADDRAFKGTYVFSQKKIVQDGVLALAIDRDKIEIISSQGFGWEGIGIQRVVTHSNQNIVYTIDDKPAIEFYTEYLNINSDDMPSMGIDFPMEVMCQDGRILTRAVVDINADGSLLCAGYVEEGSKVKISIPLGVKVIDDVVDTIEASFVDSKMEKADLVLLFPCTAHKELLGYMSKQEIEEVFTICKNSPLIGFYTYGEISSSSASFSAFHNETFLTIQLREKR